MKDYIKAFAPATVANVACAFDILGFAVDQPGDEVIVMPNGKSGITITSIIGDNNHLPLDPKKNTATVAVKAFLDKLGQGNFGLDVEINKKMPLGSGMGSSAASAAAALVAINALFDYPFSKKELIPFAMESEGVACGSKHIDNAAPAIMGGFVLIRSYEPLDVIEIPSPENLFCTLAHPILELNTSDSRRILKKEINLSIAVKQWGNIAGLISGLYSSDFQLIGRSLTDYIFEPTRSFVIPAFNEIKTAALSAGALGCSISGSGPSLFALSDSKDVAENVANAMQNAFLKGNIQSQTYVSTINKKGAIVLEEK